eukprot:926224-Pleurochrysis_carterae.AAC.1
MASRTMASTCTGAGHWSNRPAYSHAPSIEGSTSTVHSWGKQRSWHTSPRSAALLPLGTYETVSGRRK